MNVTEMYKVRRAGERVGGRLRGGAVSELCRTTHPVGRKAYRCEWCYEQIPQGEQHAHYVGVWEGEWQNWRMHEECFGTASDDDSLMDGFVPGEGDRPVREMGVKA